MLKKKQWIKEFKALLIKAGVPPYDRNIMLTWILIDISYRTLTPKESVEECIDYMYGDPNEIDIV